ALRSLQQIENVGFANLNGHLRAHTRSPNDGLTEPLCDAIGSLLQPHLRSGAAPPPSSGHTNVTKACLEGSVAWTGSLRDMIAVSRAQLQRRSQAEYRDAIAKLAADRHWFHVLERTNNVMLGCYGLGWVRSLKDGHPEQCVDWGPQRCQCHSTTLKFSLGMRACNCEEVEHWDEDVYGLGTDWKLAYFRMYKGRRRIFEC
ncbi:hypothetical protein CYMTET_12753, partial [Cymbomonas tetramitiformis]